MKVKGKVCVVTGAAGGIGEAVARRFAREGAKGVVVAETVEQAVAAVRDMLSGNRFGEAGAFSDLRASVGGRSGLPPVRRMETVVPRATCSRTGGWQGAASAPPCCPRWGGGAGSPVAPPTEAPSGAKTKQNSVRLRSCVVSRERILTEM